MSDWSVTVPPGPCEQFRSAGQAAVAADTTMSPDDKQRANAAIAQCEQIVFQTMTGQQDTQYGATIKRDVDGDTETLLIDLTASPIPE